MDHASVTLFKPPSKIFDNRKNNCNSDNNQYMRNEAKTIPGWQNNIKLEDDVNEINEYIINKNVAAVNCSKTSSSNVSTREFNDDNYDTDPSEMYYEKRSLSDMKENRNDNGKSNRSADNKTCASINRSYRPRLKIFDKNKSNYENMHNEVKFASEWQSNIQLDRSFKDVDDKLVINKNVAAVKRSSRISLNKSNCSGDSGDERSPMLHMNTNNPLKNHSDNTESRSNKNCDNQSMFHNEINSISEMCENRRLNHDADVMDNVQLGYCANEMNEYTADRCFESNNCLSNSSSKIFNRNRSNDSNKHLHNETKTVLNARENNYQIDQISKYSNNNKPEAFVDCSFRSSVALNVGDDCNVKRSYMSSKRVLGEFEGSHHPKLDISDDNQHINMPDYSDDDFNSLFERLLKINTNSNNDRYDNSGNNKTDINNETSCVSSESCEHDRSEHEINELNKYTNNINVSVINRSFRPPRNASKRYQANKQPLELYDNISKPISDVRENNLNQNLFVNNSSKPNANDSSNDQEDANSETSRMTIQSCEHGRSENEINELNKYANNINVSVINRSFRPPRNASKRYQANKQPLVLCDNISKPISDVRENNLNQNLFINNSSKQNANDSSNDQEDANNETSRMPIRSCEHARSENEINELNKYANNINVSVINRSFRPPRNAAKICQSSKQPLVELCDNISKPISDVRENNLNQNLFVNNSSKPNANDSSNDQEDANSETSSMSIGSCEHARSENEINELNKYANNINVSVINRSFRPPRNATKICQSSKQSLELCDNISKPISDVRENNLNQNLFVNNSSKPNANDSSNDQEDANSETSSMSIGSCEHGRSEDEIINKCANNINVSAINRSFRPSWNINRTLQSSKSSHILPDNNRKTVSDVCNKNNLNHNLIANHSSRPNRKLLHIRRGQTSDDTDMDCFSDFDDDSKGLTMEWQNNEDFRKISLYFEKSDLSGDADITICPILIRGAYESVNHYLDTHIRLLRADFVSCLKTGIENYVVNENYGSKSNNNDNGGIRVYRDVKFIGYHITVRNYGYIVKLNNNNNRNNNNDNNTADKRFMNGSLLVFTEDDFKHFFLGIVIDSHRLNVGLISVSLVDRNDLNMSNSRQLLFSRKYLLAESVVFFEPYFSVMKSLRSFREIDFPMKKYIVDGMQNTTHSSYPAYQRNNLNFRFNNRSFVIHNRNSWPSAADLNLDKYQREAFMSALTSEFAIIQGPPGTGKTFLGLKLVSAILENFDQNLLQSPILVVSGSNLAVDQCLEGILKYTKNIVRVGGQSKSEIIQLYNLHNLSIRNRCTLSSDEAKCRVSVSGMVKNLNSIVQANDKIRQRRCIISINSLMRFMNVHQQKWFSNDLDLLNWLADAPMDERWTISKCGFLADSNSDFISLAYDQCNTRRYINDLEEKLKQCERENSNRSFNNGVVELINNKKTQLTELIKYVRNTARTLDRNLSNLGPLSEYSTSNKFIFSQYTQSRLVPVPSRWQMYDVWAENARDKFMKDACTIEKAYSKLIEEYDCTKRSNDVQVLKNARVIGMTTSGAARNKEMLQSVKPKIVLVDEAAEILESHILASLTIGCEHLILIGDHKQLKPSAANHKLARKYNLDLSLFERMINNDMPCPRLNRQHRMRPEIAKLVSDNIYSGLENDESVHKYESVRGIRQNMFFITHDHFEDEKQAEISTSFSNTHEASFIIELCRYLIFQNYSPDEITILAMYMGQLNLITTMKQQYIMLEDVSVCTLDSYQGKENNIILLSLVRSNAENRIGFLAIENRVCVALSRAKIGFYIIGNMSCLSAKSTLWKKMKITLEQQQALGKCLTLTCQAHGTESLVTTAKDIQRVISDGDCSESCGALLKCGHTCHYLCHTKDQSHNVDYSCQQMCLKTCRFGHQCGRKCGDRDDDELLPADHPHKCVKVERICRHIPIKVCCEKVHCSKCEYVINNLELQFNSMDMDG